MPDTNFINIVDLNLRGALGQVTGRGGQLGSLQASKVVDTPSTFNRDSCSSDHVKLWETDGHDEFSDFVAC